MLVKSVPSTIWFNVGCMVGVSNWLTGFRKATYDRGPHLVTIVNKQILEEFGDVSTL